MPRVTYVKKARKANPVCKKGGSYYWWKFRHSGKRFSLTRPRASQLTQSAYFGTLYALQEEVEDTGLGDVDDWEALVDSVRSQLKELGEETQGSLDNMPDSLQYSPVGELLQERVDACESAASDIDCIGELDEFEPEDFDREEFESKDFEREGWDGDESDEQGELQHEAEQDELEEAHNAEQDDAERVHEEEQDDLADEHEQDQKEEQEAAFDSWKEDAMSAMSEAIDQAVV